MWLHFPDLMANPRFDPLSCQFFSAGIAQTALTKKANFFRVTTLFVTVFEGGVTHHHSTAGEHSVDALLDYKLQGAVLLRERPP
ncbi:hypothetical protein CI610_03348 [invertebrate metagenome]|uniref:Uncharacterized protein n=1 Tax=invertebrate metagenome TaxID=1711999 RepID=A0A2H9T3B6_9ZZZZ